MKSTEQAIEQEQPLLNLLLSRKAFLSSLGHESTPFTLADRWDDALFGPLEDFLSRAGKGFRSKLVQLSWNLARDTFGSPCPASLPLIIEMLHCGSLIIDDIEDNAEIRRGAPALHKSWGTAKSLNAGNWLYFWPFMELEKLEIPDNLTFHAFKRLTRTLLIAHQGQALDICTHIGNVQKSEIPKIVETVSNLKTGSLMGLAASIGAVVSDSTSERITVLETFGKKLGIALQMLDDLSSLTNQSRAKKGDEDLLNARPIWPWAWASELLDDGAFAQLQNLVREASHDPNHAALLKSKLKDITHFHGRRTINRKLNSAFQTAEAHFGENAILAHFQQEITQLERSYG